MKKSVACVRKAMAKLNCSKPETFFERAVKVKTAPRWFDFDTEVKNFLCLEKGDDDAHEIPRFIVACAEEVNRRNDFVERFGHFPRSVRMAWCSSGRATA